MNLIAAKLRAWKCWSHALWPLAILILLSDVGFTAQNNIYVERYQIDPAQNLTSDLLQTLAQSKAGFAEVSAAKMQVTRGKLALWRLRTDASDTPDTSDVTRPRDALTADGILAISNSFNRDVVLYFPPKYLPEKHNLYDTSVASKHSRFSLAINLPDNLNDGDAFFMAMPQPTAAALEVQILDPVRYAWRDLNLVRLHSAIVSMLLASCAVALCFFLILRERVWLLFIAYVLAQIGYVLTRTGELLAIVNSTAFDRYVWQAATIFPLLAAALLVFFAVEFVNLKTFAQRSAKLLHYYGVAILTLSVLALIPALAKSDALAACANSLLLIGVSITLYASFSSARQGSRQAVFFLIAYLPQLLVTAFFVAQMRGILSGVWVQIVFLSSYAFSSIVLSLGMADQVLGYRKQRDAAVHESESDPLTGALNRRAANRALAGEIKGLDIARGSLAVCFFDLDFFKHVNDQFGHALGDEALRLLAAQARLELRSGDFLARMGGEEFIVVLPSAYLRDGLAVAERIRARVEKHGATIAGYPVNLTVSVGVIASNPKLNSADELIDAADQALYLAKSRGRNRVETIDVVTLTTHKKEKSR